MHSDDSIHSSPQLALSSHPPFLAQSNDKKRGRQSKQASVRHTMHKAKKVISNERKRKETTNPQFHIHITRRQQNQRQQK
jgi:hypothetical protein